MIFPQFLISIISLLAISPFVEKPLLSTHNFDPYQQDIPGTSLSFGLVPIPKGEFTMGSSSSDDHAQPDEFPAHRVALDAFWMGTHEIPWEIYELFMDKEHEASSSEVQLPAEVDGLTRPSTPYLDMSFGMGKDKKPALAMTQYGAIQFCKWLYTRTGVFYRLPTEAEWEYAARAGSQSAYFFGDDPQKLEEYAWYAENSGDITHNIGEKKPNPWGLYDMYGNVAEWTLDQYLPHAYQDREGAVENPHEVATEPYPWSLRGGSYYDQAEYLRSASRYGSTENWRMRDPQFPKSIWWNTDAPFVGFRIVRDPTPPSPEEFERYWGEQTPTK